MSSSLRLDEKEEYIYIFIKFKIINIWVIHVKYEDSLNVGCQFVYLVLWKAAVRHRLVGIK